jgi:hypothetical protein
MSTKRPLVPNFINKLDDYLLKHKPEIWSARTHLVLYYGILLIAVLALIAFIVPDDPRSASPVGYWVGFVSLISIVGLVVWAIYLLRFNVFKRYGEIKPIDRLITFLLYFISIITIILFCYVEPYIESIRANNAYTDKEIVDDVNSINNKILQLEYDSLNHQWRSDTVLVRASLNNNRRRSTEAPPYDLTTTTTTDTVTLVPVPPFRLMDTAQLRISLAAGDSIIRINDSMYIFYECPEYVFLDLYTNAEIERPMRSSELYYSIIKNFKRPNRQQVSTELNKLIDKYNIDEGRYGWDGYTDDYRPRVAIRYSIHSVRSSMDHIMERKHRWDASNLEILLRMLYYSALILTLLTFTFRHSTTKTFFLSLLAAIVLSILTALFMAFSYRSEAAFLGWIIFYFLLFLVISLFIWRSKTRSVVTGISLNLFLFLIPLIPLCIVSYYYASLNYAYSDIYISETYLNKDRNLFLAEVVGFVLLLALIPTYIQAAYRKWFAAPEE